MDTGTYMANQMSDLIENSEAQFYSRLKVLTLWQPWASLLVHGVKKIETRPKPTSWTVEKGVYLIHAASKWTMEQEKICMSEPFRGELNKILPDLIQIGWPYWRNYLPLGQIIGAIEILDCKKIYQYPFNSVSLIKLGDTDAVINEPELLLGDYSNGRYAWLTQNPRVIKTPIPYKGGQGYYQNFKGDINEIQFL